MLSLGDASRVTSNSVSRYESSHADDYIVLNINPRATVCKNDHVFFFYFVYPFLII